MRWIASVCAALGLMLGNAEAKKVKTPKSPNARAQGATHKSKGKHAGQKVKVRKKREKFD